MIVFEINLSKGLVQMSKMHFIGDIYFSSVYLIKHILNRIQMLFL